MFDEERISTVAVDQASPSSISLMCQRVACSSFDFIVNDGLHTFAEESFFFRIQLPTVTRFCLRTTPVT